MKTLYLHIGYPKTGTTGIQNFLTLNTVALAQQGVLVPETGMLNGAHYQFNFALNIGHYNDTKPILPRAELQARLRAEADASPCSKIIISSEYFCTAHALDGIKTFFKDYDIRAICYLRRHDLSLESAFSQVEKTVLKPAWDGNIESYALYTLCNEDAYHNYLYTLRRWAAVFGAKALIVRPFEAEQNRPDLYADFLTAIGVTDSPSFVRPKSANPSVGHETLAAIRFARTLNLPKPVSDMIVARLIANDGAAPSEKYFRPAMRTAIVNKYRASYGVIAKEFMQRPDGRLFHAPYPTPADDWTPPAEIKTEQIMERIALAMAGTRP